MLLEAVVKDQLVCTSPGPRTSRMGMPVRVLRRALSTSLMLLCTPLDRAAARRRIGRLLEAQGMRPVAWSVLDGNSGLFPARVDLEGGQRCFVKAAGWAWLGRRRTSRRERLLLEVLDGKERLRRGTALSRRIHDAGLGPAVLAAGEAGAAWEWVGGARLRMHLADGGDAAAALEAVEALHRAGEVHGDLHADNVVLGTEGAVNLLDPEDRFRPGVAPQERLLYDWGLLLGSLCGTHARVDALVLERLGMPAHGVEGSLGEALERFLPRYRTDNRYLDALAGYIATAKATSA